MAILGPLVSEIAAGFARRKQRKHEFKLAEYQYSKDLEQWNRANAYNTPSAQMQRYRDAGLNPNIVAGGVGSSVGTATESPKYQAPRAEYGVGALPDPGMLLNMYQDFRLKSAQTDLVKEKTLSEAASRVSKKARGTLDRELAKYAHSLAFSAATGKEQEWMLKQNQNLLMRDTYHSKVRQAKATAGKVEADEAYRMRELRDYQDIGMRASDSFILRFLYDLYRKAGSNYVKPRFFK